MASWLLRVILALSLTLSAACATSREQTRADGGQHQAQTPAGNSQRSESRTSSSQRTKSTIVAHPQERVLAGGATWAEEPPVRINSLPGGRLRLSFPTSVPFLDQERLSVEEIRPLLVAFMSFRPRATPRLRLMLGSPGETARAQGTAAPWELRLREVLPKVPEGGLWTLLSPMRHAPASGPALESIATAHVVADGSLIIAGVAMGTSAAAVRGELATCAMMDDAGGASTGGPKLSTRYGKPHTRKNPPHNEAIEAELARREASGHTDLRKNQAQVDGATQPVLDQNPVRGIRFRKPTNYDRLDGTLVRRYVPMGVSFP